MPNWDDAFANAVHIPDSDRIIASWPVRAAAYRQSGVSIEKDIRYGPAPRHKLDLVWPPGKCKGLVVFVHGGFWMSFDKSDWTDLAEGARAQGWAVALPSYTLAPDARISAMTKEVSAATTVAASLVSGAVRLAGHSAGGHLVARLICDDSPLDPSVLDRIERVVSISGLHDLRPLLQTRMNASLRLSAKEAAAESPTLRLPVANIPVTSWVGASERPEFIRQSRILATQWGEKADTKFVEEPEMNHFSIVDGLNAPGSPIVAELLNS